MTEHLLILTLGPVQDFIAQARRTRDLWCGSHLLSELSRAAARYLADEGAQLVFPALSKGDPELEPCWREIRAGAAEPEGDAGISRWRDPPTKKPPRNVANKIVATLPAQLDARRVARGARDAVLDAWRRHARLVKRRCASILTPGIDAAWDEQIESLLEVAAAWTPLHGDYVRAREQAEAAIAGRKHLREFSAWTSLRGAVERSSLDGGRETVLVSGKDGPTLESRRRLGIRPTEQLDAVSLCKRAGGRPEQFVPTPNIALARWIERADEVAPKQMEALRQACEAAQIRRVQGAGQRWWQALPYYADVLLESQIAQVLQESGHGDAGSQTASQWFERHVRPVLRPMSEPHGYLAALVADGDHMGQAIEQLHSPQEHRRFSEVLAGFAEDARAIVEVRHRGELVYAGGDDVLALVCLTDALQCARDLRAAFGERMRAFASGSALAEVPTLSVGLGIAHRTEGLGDLIQLGREAEQIAKQAPEPHGGHSRNALAVVVTPHSGQRRAWRANWDDGHRCPVAQLRRDIERTTLPTGKVHAIEDAVRRLDGAAPAVLRGEVQRILAHTADGADECRPADVGLNLEGATEEPLGAAVRRFVDRQLVARMFSRAEQSTRPKQEHVQ